jgi:hypothetical protein
MVSSFKKPYFNSHNLYLFGAISICIGLSLSKPLLGLGQILMLIGWISDGNIKHKLKDFFTNPLAIALIAFFGLTLLGLINTSDYSYAFKDIKRKLPLFILPLVLFSKRFTAKEIKLFFVIYVGGVLASSFWSVFVKLGGLGIEITDYRDLSRFNSHIRFGLEICLAIFGAGYYFIKSQSFKEKVTWIITIIWLCLFMVLISLFTGIVVLTICSFILILAFGNGFTSPLYRYIVLITFLVGVIIVGVKIDHQIQGFYSEVKLLEKKRFTSNWSVYYDNPNAKAKENGYDVWKNNCWDELEKSWNKRSKIRFQDNDLKGQPLKTTLIRFITSKGEYKDQVAVEKLTQQEVEAIENGIANYKLMSMSSIDKRLFDLLWEYDNYKNGGDYNGHSVIMRLEYWKTGIQIFMNNQLLGVRTGDIQTAFDKQYEINNSILKPQFRLRAHNQFITILATFGLFGIIIFGWFLFYPIIKTSSYQSFLYMAFFLIILVSMLTEDTLDTQIGITFFAFFNTLFIINSSVLKED